MEVLLDNLSDHQIAAVKSPARRLLIVAGAGSGKTEVVARRVAWWVGVEGVAKDRILAFTFTEKAAEEMKFRIRKWIGRITPKGHDATLGSMYVGTMHGFCVRMLREHRPDAYGMYDVLDEAGRLALVNRGFHPVLGLSRLQSALTPPGARRFGQFATIDRFLFGYDLLNEYGHLRVRLPEIAAPTSHAGEAEWCKEALMLTDVGTDEVGRAFGESAARYHAYLHARRFLDFSTSQAECVKRLEDDTALLEAVNDHYSHIVVDEVQDVNPVQDRLVRALVGRAGTLTAVGDHRQAIFGWRGGRVEIMARLFEDLQGDPDGETVDLPDNFRSTQRIVDLANAWARTIDPVKTMTSPDMTHGRPERVDAHSSHVAILTFDSRLDEASWIARAVRRLVDGDTQFGALHDKNGTERGIGYSDVAVLVRSTTSVRDYLEALDRAGIPAVVRAGPDLFSRPEVLLMLAALGRAAGLDEFYGGWQGLPNLVNRELACEPKPEPMIHAAAQHLRVSGLPMDADTAERLLLASALIRGKTAGARVSAREAKTLHTPPLVAWLSRASTSRRIFPQTIFQWLAAEAGSAGWDRQKGRGGVAMYHLGQLSQLITGLETPGWVSPSDFKYQVIALTQWGAGNARTEEAPLLAPPNAITVTTIHSAKGLDWPVVFVADVATKRFPSSMAKRVTSVPYSGTALRDVNPAGLADNDNLDDERRLLYVAMTRAQRYLFVSSSKPSSFFNELIDLAPASGALVDGDHALIPRVRLLPTEVDPMGANLVTSFSDLRYYLECPHDYYLRKVLGFAPSIDQAFGYGRAVHNLMREIHRDPAHWAGLSDVQVEPEVQNLIDGGMFYLRYTTGEPLERMRARGKEIVADYVRNYRDELAALTFEPEREFETLLETSEGGVLVSGAIDLIRRDDPPTVTLIDFKSGEPDSDLTNKLDAEEMRLQISLYGLAAKKELEYQPDLGLVRYLGEPDPTKRELVVPLNEAALQEAGNTVIQIAESIQRRHWDEGPRRKPRTEGNRIRCQECDFVLLCGRPEASSV